MSKGIRFKTYFGVPIPPFKEDKLGAGAVTIRFVLTGNIISKKNNEQAVAVRKPARDWVKQIAAQQGGMLTLDQVLKSHRMIYAKIRGNAEYLKFLQRMRPVLQEQMQSYSKTLGKHGLIFPLSKANLSFQLYIKDRYRRDTVNAQQTIQDLFKDAGVIIDDDDRVIRKYIGASARYYEELIHNIAFIQLTFRLEGIDNKINESNEVVDDDMMAIDVG